MLLHRKPGMPIAFRGDFSYSSMYICIKHTHRSKNPASHPLVQHGVATSGRSHAGTPRGNERLVRREKMKVHFDTKSSLVHDAMNKFNDAFCIIVMVSAL